MSGSSLSTNTLQQALALNAAAWERIVRLYQPLLYGRCRRSGLDPDDAADVVQDAILSAFKSVGTFRLDGTTRFRSWLLGITNNKLKDHWERIGRQPQAEGGSEAQRRIDQAADSSDGPDDEVERARLLGRALELIQGQFEPRTWEAFVRFQSKQQTAAEIAAELGMTANAVHVAASRVRKRLREEFAELL
jgi:RNA polymerase sigma-70 factor (ECF subfamily)